MHRFTKLFFFYKKKNLKMGIKRPQFHLIMRSWVDLMSTRFVIDQDRPLQNPVTS